MTGAFLFCSLMGLDMGAFEQAWTLLKANPYMMSYGKTVHPSVANYMMMGNEIIDETENPREDGSVMSREELQEMARHLVSERMKSTALDNPTPFGPYGQTGKNDSSGKPRFMFPEEERTANLRTYDMYGLYDPEFYEGQLEQR